METMENKIFGKLVYDFQWEKKDSVSCGNQKFSITTIVEALPGESISSVQESNYQMIQQKKNLIDDDGITRMIGYLNKAYNLHLSDSASLFGHVALQSVLYKQNGKVVALFSVPEDELGMGLELYPNKSIGVQDLYL